MSLIGKILSYEILGIYTNEILEINTQNNLKGMKHDMIFYFFP